MKRHDVRTSYVWIMDHHGQRHYKVYYCTRCKEQVSLHMDGRFYHIEG